MSDINKIVIQMINKYAPQKQKEYFQDMLLTDIGYTSLAFVCLIMELEEFFDIVFEDEILVMNGVKIKTFIDYVSERIGHSE